MRVTGRPDVFVSQSSSWVVDVMTRGGVWRNDRRGRLAHVDGSEVREDGSRVDAEVALDINGDGRLDVAIIDGSGEPRDRTMRLVVSLGNGDGTFRVGPIVHLAPETSGLAVMNGTLVVTANDHIARVPSRCLRPR